MFLVVIPAAAGIQFSLALQRAKMDAAPAPA